MSLARVRDHDRRLARLAATPAARLSAGEIAEMQRIERARDQIWQSLPGRIDRLRHTLAELEAYAREIGMEPC